MACEKSFSHTPFYVVHIYERGEEKMKYILTASQMKYADKRMIENIGIPSMVLMERAALQTVKAMKEVGIDLKKTLIVCGSGNNGGDGFAIGRLLIEEGYEPEIIFVGNPESRSEETRIQMQILTNMGVDIGNSLPEKEYSVIIDAVFGIGLSRNIEGKYQTVIEKMNAYTGCKVAVDIASGVSADDGKILGCAFKADYTVTFAYAKAGQLLFPGKIYSGEIMVRQIGIVNPELDNEKDVYYTFEKQDIKEQIAKRIPDSNKGSYGRVLLIAGSKGMSGAAYLSAKAAYLSGSGLVRIYTEESNRQILQQLLPEAVMTTYLEKDTNPFDQLDELLGWADVICLGCGLGMSDASKLLVKKVLEKNEKPCVVDADALNIFSELEKTETKSWLKKQGQYVFTPHMKEMSRLTGQEVSEIKNNRIEILKKFINEYPVTCVLKDSRTLVLEKDEQCYLNTSGNAAMAKAGAGDVLAGIITGLMAQKTTAYKAAVLGVYIHGLAGDEARKECGAYSVLAEDLLTGLRMILRGLEEK